MEGHDDTVSPESGMIAGIGVDVVSVLRFRALGEKKDFLREVFLAAEIERAPPASGKDRYFAALFAVKEAFLKSLGLGLAAGFPWHDIEVGPDGRIQCSGGLAERVHAVGIGDVHATVSSTDAHAIAFVILETTTGDTIA